MAWMMPVAISAGSMMSAGGALGGAAMQGGSTMAPGAIPIYNPAFDPITGAASIQNMAMFGMFDPSMMASSGPLGRHISMIGASGVTGGTGDKGGLSKQSAQAVALREAYSIVGQARQGGFTGKDGARYSPEEARAFSADQILDLSPEGRQIRKMANRSLGLSGFADLDSLFGAEAEYQTNVGAFIEQQRVSAEQSRAASAFAEAERLGLLQDLPGASQADIEAQRDAEFARMDMLMQREQQRQLAAANAGGFNPAAALEEGARLRETADAEALNRAVATIMGTQQASAMAAQNLNTLDPRMQAMAYAPTAAQMRTPVPLGGANPGTPGINPMGPAVGQAGGAFGEALQTYAFVDMLNKDAGGGGTGGGGTGGGGGN
jgi:hypothetical protein